MIAYHKAPRSFCGVLRYYLVWSVWKTPNTRLMIAILDRTDYTLAVCIGYEAERRISEEGILLGTQKNFLCSSLQETTCVSV